MMIDHAETGGMVVDDLLLNGTFFIDLSANVLPVLDVHASATLRWKHNFFFCSTAEQQQMLAVEIFMMW